MIARETSNRFKTLLITDKCQQKVGVLQTTVHTGRSPRNYSLQTTARPHGSSPAEIDSELVSHRWLDVISVVIGDRHSFVSLRLLPPFDTVSVVPTAYRRFTVHRLWCPRISSNSFCTETLITVGLALLMAHKQKYRKSSHSIIHASSS